jgi:hypothetical protein
MMLNKPDLEDKLNLFSEKRPKPLRKLPWDSNAPFAKPEELFVLKDAKLLSSSTHPKRNLSKKELNFTNDHLFYGNC